MLVFKKISVVFLFLVLSTLQAQQNSIQKFTINNGLTSNIIFDITQDEIGYLWIATNKGLLKFDGDNFTQIIKQKTTTVLSQNNTVYVGLETGLLIKNSNQEQFLASKKVIHIFSFKKDVFVGTNQGIYKLEKDYLKPLQINAVVDFSIINDLIFENNSFYVATNKGLWKLNSLNKPKEVEIILKDHVTSLLKFQNKIIAATFQNGLKIIDNNFVEKTITTQQSVSSVKKLKNEIWVTSDKNGIEVFTLPSFSFKQKINKYNSLETNDINTVFKDRQNTVWIASNNGLYQLKTVISNYSNSHKPVIYFESLFVNNQNTDSLLSAKNTTTFSPSENNISIYFKTVDLLNPRKIKYRYKLDHKFSSWSTNNSVQFANLNAGKYTFEIQSKIDDKFSEIKSFLFIIDTPFYKKSWFILSAIILFLFAGYLFLDIYIKNLNKKNKEKIDTLKLENHLLSLEQKALQLQMNPHFIFNVLNGIKALGNSGKTAELNTTISRFSVLLRSILNNSRKEKISLKEEIESLKNYIELEQEMSSKNFEYSFTINLNAIDPDEILIPTMLIQPFIENTIQHGFEVTKKGKITISFEVKNNFLHCTIIDNGIGIHQSKKRKESSNHNSVALKISKERIENIATKNSFSIDEIIQDSVIKGTKVWFKIPLKTDY
jgi:two-component system sensor histidine kinase LytS